MRIYSKAEMQISLDVVTGNDHVAGPVLRQQHKNVTFVTFISAVPASERKNNISKSARPNCPVRSRFGIECSPREHPTPIPERTDVKRI